MGLESVNYQCPACGGPLRYDGGKGKLVCDHCDSEFEVAQIEAMFATAEAKAEERAAGAGAQTLDGGYVCASCGAQGFIHIPGAVPALAQQTLGHHPFRARHI